MDIKINILIKHISLEYKITTIDRIRKYIYTSSSFRRFLAKRPKQYIAEQGTKICVVLLNSIQEYATITTALHVLQTGSWLLFIMLIYKKWYSRKKKQPNNTYISANTRIFATER